MLTTIIVISVYLVYWYIEDDAMRILTPSDIFYNAIIGMSQQTAV